MVAINIMNDRIMNPRKKLLLLATLSFVMLLGLFSCEDHQARFEDPTWLGGTNIETLESYGNYSIFLKLMEKAKYTESVSKILYTLFVPSDELFMKYFQEKGIASVDELTEDQAFQLFTLHVLVNPRSSYNLKYEYAWDEQESPIGEYGSLFLRKRTPSRSTPYLEYIKYHDQYAGRTFTIYTSDKYVPLWSKDFFEDYFAATDGSDYKFIYPGSNYDNSSDLADQAMNWHNAMVLPNPENPTELAVRTSSGFIYFIDQVVAPMPSIEEYLIANLDKYGLFYDLMQRFADYGSPVTDADRNVSYRKSYESLPNIADDGGPAGTSQYEEPRMSGLFTAFIPKDDVFQKYLDDNILNTYVSIDSIPEITLLYILGTHLNNSLCLLSKMEDGFFNGYGDALTLKKEDFNSGYMCSNGAFYDIKKVLEPNAFTSVTGELFFNKNYSTFLFAINNAGFIRTISSPEQRVTLFAPTNDQLEAANIRYNSDDGVIQYFGPDMVWRTMKDDQLIMFVQYHIAMEKLSDLSGEGFVKMTSGNYIHYSNNTIQGPENQFLKENVSITDSKEKGENGILYKINNAVKSRYYTMGKLLWFDPDLTEFATLLDKSTLLNRRIKDPITKELTPTLKFTSSSEEWTVFAPTNAAIQEAKAAGLIPSDRDSLKAFLQYHFIRDKVIFDDGITGLSGTYPTHTLAPVTPEGPKYLSVTVVNNKNNLTVTDGQGTVITVDHAMANNLAQKSVVHKINSILRY